MLDQLHTLVVVEVVLALLVVMHLGQVVLTLLEMELQEVVVLVEQTLEFLDHLLAQSCLVHG